MLWVTTATAAPRLFRNAYKKSPVFRVMLNENWKWKLEIKRQDQPPPDNAIKYWTGSRLYFPQSNDKLENALLTKEVLGPVAVMMDLALRRKGFKIIGMPPRRVPFLKALLDLSQRLVWNFRRKKKDDSKLLLDRSPKKWIEEMTGLLGDDCVKALQTPEYEEIRQIYREEIINYREDKPDFEGGNPPFYASNGYRGWIKKDIKKWRLIDAINIGTMQVKCRLLRRYEADRKLKEEEVAPDGAEEAPLSREECPFTDVLIAKLGRTRRLFISPTSGWKLDYESLTIPDKAMDIDDVPMLVAAEVTKGNVAATPEEAKQMVDERKKQQETMQQ